MVKMDSLSKMEKSINKTAYTKKKKSMSCLFGCEFT